MLTLVAICLYRCGSCSFPGQGKDPDRTLSELHFLAFWPVVVVESPCIRGRKSYWGNKKDLSSCAYRACSRRGFQCYRAVGTRGETMRNTRRRHGKEKRSKFAANAPPPGVDVAITNPNIPIARLTVHSTSVRACHLTLEFRVR